MSGKFVINLTRAKDDTDRATVAFIVANAALASEKEVVVFLNVEGTYLSQVGYADDIHEAGLAPLKELMTDFVDAGGRIFVCSQCLRKRKLDENNLIPGVKVAGGAALVEFMGDACPSISY